jgi:aspartyl-tRNA(Asn)/glutamyl-tRNA(Gln) amidotransferase subunit C
MNIDTALVDRLAELSKLEFEDAEKQRLVTDLQKIMNLIDKLNEVDVTGVAPLVYMNDTEVQWREDEIKGMVTKSEALLNAPQKDSDYFKVPKVIKK